MRLVYFTLAWAAGIVAATQVFALTASAWLVLVLALMLILIGLSRSDGADLRPLRVVLILLLGFASGGFRYALYPATSGVTAYINSGGLTLEGVVVDAPDIRDDRTYIRLAVEQINRGGDVRAVDGLVLVQSPRYTAVRYGDRIQATGSLIHPAEFDTFSYADYLARGGVFAILRNASVEPVSSGGGNPVFAGLFAVRERAAGLIAAGLPEPQAGLLTGILLGNERGIAPEVQDAFSQVGAAHVIAISGFNMAIVSGIITAGLSRLLRRRLLAGIGAIGVIILYTLLVGANAAVVRAAVMSSLLVIATLVRRKTYLPASLAFAALLMSALNPTVLWDIGFQLSLFATLGIALFADPLTRRFDAWLSTRLTGFGTGVLADLLTEPLIVTIAALIFTLPLTVMYFGRLPLLILPVNLLIVPVQAALLLIGGAATLLALLTSALAIPVVAGVVQLLYWLDMVLLSWTIEVVRVLARLPFSSVEYTVDARLAGALLVIVAGGMMMHAAQPEWWLALVRWIRRREVVNAVAASGVMTALLMVGLVAARPDGKLHVWFLDMGHSSAVLMQTPGGAQMLVDGGRFPSRLLTAIGDRLPFNDRELEVLLLTVPDENQVAALPAVLNRYQTGVVLVNGQSAPGDAYTELEAQLAERRTLTVTSGYSVNVDDGVRLDILNPRRTPPPGDASATSLGDNGLVVRVQYGAVSFLLTGQLTPDGQTDVINGDIAPQATVLQLPRQASARSLLPEFLDAVYPSLVVLQSDPANLRGDPDPDVLALIAPEVPLLRTDQQGTIHVWTDGVELWSVTEE